MSTPKKKSSYSSAEDEDLALQPWFLPRSVAWQIRKILPSVHLAKMRYYFDDHGCLRCERPDFLYGSDGMCENCSVVVRRRLANCLEKRLRSLGVMENSPHTLSDCVSSARDIIGRPRIRKDK